MGSVFCRGSLARLVAFCPKFRARLPRSIARKIMKQIIWSVLLVAPQAALEALAQAARALGVQFTTSGRRAVLTCLSPRSVYTLAGVRPTIHGYGRATHAEACKEWL